MIWIVVVVRKTEDWHWILLLEAEQKAKKENIEKRQLKLKQESYIEEIIEISRSGNTTVTDNEFVCVVVFPLALLISVSQFSKKHGT